MELRDVISQIDEIRSHVARTETFRGYRSVSVGSTGALAIAAAGAQSLWIPEPSGQTAAWLVLWLTVAVLSVLLVAIEMAVRCRRSASPWTLRLTWLAIQQFAPCLLAGGAVTAALVLNAVESLWMLPGLWSVLFSLGIFASCGLLPRAMHMVAAYYLIAGVVCLCAARGDAALAPWTMAGTFGVGQLLVATVLYWRLERSDDRA